VSDVYIKAWALQQQAEKHIEPPCSKHFTVIKELEFEVQNVKSNPVGALGLSFS
jgi:hypothetical protein